MSAHDHNHADIAETYFRELANIHASGSAVKETSYYGPLANLLNAVGKQLKPRIQCIVHLQNDGAGIPDGGLFSEDQLRKGNTAELGHGAKPSRGVIEAKPVAQDVRRIAATPQVTGYWQAYRQVLVTTYREFLLIAADADGRQTTAESFSLAPTEAAFWQSLANPRAFAREQGQRLIEYLKRVFLQSAQIATPRDVAELLASYARDARHRVESVDAARLDGLRHVFAEALGLTFSGERGEHFFRSSLVQTLFYGIFSAWVLWSKRHPPSSKSRFDWRISNWDLKIPVLRKLFSEVAEPGQLDESGLVEILDWAGGTLHRVDRAAFFRTFADEDAVQYFYEPFLEAFDPELRKELGVWYTPREIVQYMVARVDAALREKLHLPDGLADPRVVVLDPCCGTGAFLVEVLHRIARTLRDKGEDALLAHEVKRAAIERVFGFELLTAPFVVSHLEIGALIQQLGGEFGKNERPGVYLTNALTGWEPPAKPKTFLFPEFKEESDAADHVKRDAQILVILGNPPYNSYAGVSELDEERRLTTAYKVPADPRLAKPQGQGLNDLYVRFYRIAERRIVDRSNTGLVCFISNYSWLDGLSHTVMRERFLKEFDEIAIDSLNGDKYRTGKVTPDGLPDPSVFSTSSNREGIQVGTAIALMLRTPLHQAPAMVKFRNLWGTGKRMQLALEAETGTTPAYLNVAPKWEMGLIFTPGTTASDYLQWPLLTDLFPVSFPGIKTSRDAVVVDIDRDRLEKRMQNYFNPKMGFEEITMQMPDAAQSASGFDAKYARRKLIDKGIDNANFVRFCYRPFDVRWLYWEPDFKLLDRPRSESRIHHDVCNLWIAACQQNRKNYSPPIATRSSASLHVIERGANLFPAYLRSSNLTFGEDERGMRPNASPELLNYLAAQHSEIPDAFNHALAILHSPEYALQNAAALRQDWPRIPMPATADALTHSAALGRRVATLLDPETPAEGVTTGALRPELRSIASISPATEGHQLDPARDFNITAGWGHAGKGGVTMPARGRTLLRDYSPSERAALEAISDGLSLLGERTLDIFLNDAAYWRNIPEAVWEYTIGGYQVLKKWLSYREQELLNRSLHLEEVREFTNIARRIAALLLLGPSLDVNYEIIRNNAASFPTR